ncbi:hypothetical protein EVAR_69438_1 [Eumeta japonica]|uniref:Uncharacterized protein n=1 Tax=Eumeta variegata TaxID=151549 RepID=A0A4C2A6Q3_EUMVA|nr:hypothetical protein EVAR_69438_1 [Eumeta japonica]
MYEMTNFPRKEKWSMTPAPRPPLRKCASRRPMQLSPLYDFLAMPDISRTLPERCRRRVRPSRLPPRPRGALRCNIRVEELGAWWAERPSSTPTSGSGALGADWWEGEGSDRKMDEWTNSPMAKWIRDKWRDGWTGGPNSFRNSTTSVRTPRLLTEGYVNRESAPNLGARQRSHGEHCNHFLLTIKRYAITWVMRWRRGAMGVARDGSSGPWTISQSFTLKCAGGRSSCVDRSLLFHFRINEAFPRNHN